MFLQILTDYLEINSHLNMILINKNYSQFSFIQNFQAFELKKTDILKLLSKKTDMLKFLSKKKLIETEIFQLFPKKTDLA